MHVAHLVPQGAVRRRAIGTTRRPPTDSDLVEMQRLTRRGMASGAWGMSTGLGYVPSVYAGTKEIAVLARVVAEYRGIYASQIRSEGDQLFDAIDKAIQIGRLSGAAVHISHFKASNRRNWGKVRAAAKMIEGSCDHSGSVPLRGE